MLTDGNLSGEIITERQEKHLSLLHQRALQQKSKHRVQSMLVTTTAAQPAAAQVLIMRVSVGNKQIAPCS